MIRRLLNAPGKWVTSSLALAARFSGRKSITRHRQRGLVAERRRGCGGYNAAAGGAEAMRHAEMEVWRTERVRCRSGRDEKERVEGGGDAMDLSSISHSIKFIKFN